MTDRRRRAIDIGLLTMALIGIFLPLVIDNYRQDQRADDQEELAELRADELAAFEMKVCVYGNDAKRTARQDADVAISVLIDGLRMSPHGALADQLEAGIRSRMSTAASSDHDCNGDGVIGDPGDYPTP